MKTCPYCRESIPDDARKCKECGEMLSIVGPFLRFVPFISALIAAGSLVIAWTEIQGRVVAEFREKETAEELTLKEDAADQALAKLAQQIPVNTRAQVKLSLNLQPGMTLDKLESQARRDPRNLELQRKAMLLKAIERP